MRRRSRPSPRRSIVFAENEQRTVAVSRGLARQDGRENAIRRRKTFGRQDQIGTPGCCPAALLSSARTCTSGFRRAGLRQIHLAGEIV